MAERRDRPGEGNMPSSSSWSKPPAAFVNLNPYNRFLPNRGSVESDADKYLDWLTANFVRCFSGMGRVSWNCAAAPAKPLESPSALDPAFKPELEPLDVCRWLTEAQNYMVLYGLRIPKATLLYWIKSLLEVVAMEEAEPGLVERVCKVAAYMLKKTHLLEDLAKPATPDGGTEAALVIDWKPLYQLMFKWDRMVMSNRGILKITEEDRAQLKGLVFTCRPFFSEESTAEMLAEWRPFLCPMQKSSNFALKYMSLFLPTSPRIPPEKGYLLWFDELFALWRSFSNQPTWENDLMVLWSRLAHDNVGRIDWSRHVEPVFVKTMSDFHLPCTFGNSGFRLNAAVDNVSSGICFKTVATWIVSAINGGESSPPSDDPVQRHLDKMLLVIESYFHPANHSMSSDLLHSFVSNLCTTFVDRVHVERYNKKWECKTPKEKRLTDDAITHFVKSLVPVALHVAYNDYPEDRRCVFSSLSTLRPNIIMPPLLDRIRMAADTLTEPHRLRATIGTVSACSMALVEHYPAEVLGLIDLLLPGIDVNDVGKSCEIFVFLSDLLDTVWLVDFSGGKASSRRSSSALTSGEATLVARSAMSEHVALQFTDRCMCIIENCSREQTRQDSEALDDYLNEDEMVVDMTISETFQKLVSRCSGQIFDAVFRRIQRHVQTRILEPAVSGSILAGMCNACVVIQPEMTLKFFVPFLCSKVEAILKERVNLRKVDRELQYSMVLLSEVLDIKDPSYAAAKAESVDDPSKNFLTKYVDQICSRVLDRTLDLCEKDENERAAEVLEALLFNLSHIRMVKKFLAADKDANNHVAWSKEEFSYCRLYSLEEFEGVEWYVPSEAEVSAVKNILDRYLRPSLKALDDTSGLDKETTLRHLKRIKKILSGAAELLPCLPDKKSPDFPATITLTHIERNFISWNGQNIRQIILQTILKVQDYLLNSRPDDTDSLLALVSIYDELLTSLGVDEEDLMVSLEDHKALKRCRENKLIRSKRHIEQIQFMRINIQHQWHMCLKNFLDISRLPVPLLEAVFQLAVSHYSDVRVSAQDLLSSILMKVPHDAHAVILAKVVECLEESPDVSTQRFKGALHILGDSFDGFFGCWEFLSEIMPRLVRAQHTEDKTSIIEKLKDLSHRCNRGSYEFGLDQTSVRPLRPSKDLLRAVLSDSSHKQLLTCLEKRLEAHVKGHEKDDDVNVHYLKLEEELFGLVGNGGGPAMHWRHRQMALGMLHSMIVPKRRLPEKVLRMWFSKVIDEDREVRLIAIQALVTAFKLAKRKRTGCQKKLYHAHQQEFEASTKGQPGLRPDNEWLQYDERLFVGDGGPPNKEYWQKPFVIKPDMGYYAWPHDQEGWLHVSEDVEDETSSSSAEAKIPDCYRKVALDFFGDGHNTRTFVDLSSMEFTKRDEYLSINRADLMCALVECVGPEVVKPFLPHVHRLAEVPQTDRGSEQRAAAEFLYGCVRGSRYYGWNEATAIVGSGRDEGIAALLTTALKNLSTTSVADWQATLTSAISKTDPNRVWWIYEKLFSEARTALLQGSSFHGSANHHRLPYLSSSRECMVLRLLDRCLEFNWKLRSLMRRTYSLVISQCDHPFQKVRACVAKLLATVTSLEAPYMNRAGDCDIKDLWNMGSGMPTKVAFLKEVLPRLSLNFHNPEVSNGVHLDDEEDKNEVVMADAVSTVMIGPDVMVAIKAATNAMDFAASDHCEENGDDFEGHSVLESSIADMEEDMESIKDLSIINGSFNASSDGYSKEATPTSGTNGEAHLHRSTLHRQESDSSPKRKRARLMVEEDDDDVVGQSVACNLVAKSVPPKNLTANIKSIGGRQDPSARVLDTAASWTWDSLTLSSATVYKELYDLLPFLCQFTGGETDHETSQSCLRALCALSVSTVPPHIVPTVLDMVRKVTQSTSWKSKLSVLEFLQVFVFHNFLALCLHQESVVSIEDTVLSMMKEDHPNVQYKAAKVLGGLIHSHFLDEGRQAKLLALFRLKVASNATAFKELAKAKKRRRLDSTSSGAAAAAAIPTASPTWSEFLSGIHGLCSMVLAYPYDIPEFVPEVLVELESHLHDPQPVPKVIKQTIQEFKRTHQDNWEEHKLKFSQDQLLVVTDLLVSPNYYA